jgi:flagellar motor switch protein FliM
VAPAQLFDFRDPLPLPAGAARLVAAVTDAAPRVGLLLGLACGRDLAVRCAGVRRVALKEVATAAAVWTPLSGGLPEPGLLLVPAETAVVLADLYLGGLGEGEDRPTTPLEQQLLVRHTLPALRPLAQALAEHGVTGFAAGAVSDEPLPVGGGEVVAVPLDVELPSGATVRLTVCLPAKSLLPTDPGSLAHAPTAAAEAALGSVPVEVSVRLPVAVLSASEVEDLQPGDVLQLASGAADAVVGVLHDGSADVPVFVGSLGRRDTRRAVAVQVPVPTAAGGL